MSSLRRLLARFRSRPALPPPRPPLPFVPFHVEPLSPEDVANALRGRQDEYIVRSVMQLIEGEMWESVQAMADGHDGARGEFRALLALYQNLVKLVGGKG